MAIGDITEYHIVANRVLDRLIHNVNEYIKDGWQPHGNFSTSEEYKTFTIYCQPMVKRKQPPLFTDNTKVIP